MSFVLFAGCQYFGILIGDKRVSDSNGKILDENVNKVKRINSNLIIGAGGDEVLITALYKKLFDTDKLTNNMSAEECLEIIKTSYDIISNKSYIANFGICERTETAIKYISIAINKNDIEISKKIYSTDEDYDLYYIAYGLKDLDKTFFDLFIKSGRIFSLANLKSVFYQTLKARIKDDYTINDRFSYEILIRGDIYDERKDRPK